MKEMNILNISSYIDSTNLKQNVSKLDIEELCNQALIAKFAAVCIPQFYLNIAIEKLMGSVVKLCTVVGFPLGHNFTKSKILEAEEAIQLGAEELDVVANISAIKNNDWNYVANELVLLSNICKSASIIMKVIIETALLTQIEKIEMCRIVSDIGADFVKTSTGYASSGATIADVKLLKKNVSSNVKVKASGGIKTLDFAISLIKAGASRIGTSSAISIYDEFVRRNTSKS